MPQTSAQLQRAAPEVPVSDMDDALAYYRDSLGFETKSLMPEGDYAVIQRDDVALHLFRGEPGQGAVSFHVFTRDLDALFAELRDRGARITQEIESKPWGNRDFRIADISGNEIKFTGAPA